MSFWSDCLENGRPGQVRHVGEEEILKRKYDIFQIILVLELLIILALLPGCFFQAQLADAFSGEDVTVTEIEGRWEVCGNRVRLSPGVYQVRVWAEPAPGQSMKIHMEHDGAAYKALRSNGMTMEEGSRYGDFDVYVSDKVESAYVQCDFYTVGPEGKLRVEMWKTSMGNRIWLVLSVTMFLALDFMVLFRRRILAGKVSGRQQVVFWALCMGVLLAYFPYLTDYFSAGENTAFYWGRIGYLADVLRGADSLEMGGETQLAYNFAPFRSGGDLFLMIPVVLRLTGFSLMDSYKMFVLITLAATAVIAYVSLKKCVKDEYGALYGSMLYLLTPYHLYIVYGRGAVEEYVAMAFLPLVCCGMYLLYTEDTTSKTYGRYKWYLAAGISAILHSHLFTLEMTLSFIFLTCILLWKKTMRGKRIVQLLQAAGIVLGGNVWFWGPMIYKSLAGDNVILGTAKGPVQDVGAALGGFCQFLPNMGGVQVGMWHCKPVQAGAAAVMLVFVYLLWRYQDRNGRRAKDRECGFFVISSVLFLGIGVGIFYGKALLDASALGEMGGVLDVFSGWMSLATVMLSFFAAFFVRRIRADGGMLIKASAGIVAAIMVFSAVYHVNDIAFESEPLRLYDEESLKTVSGAKG